MILPSCVTIHLLKPSWSSTLPAPRQSISVDEYNNVIYWARIDGSNHRVMRTLLNGDTVDLNITYYGEIDLTSDVFNFYVLDQENGRIDKYLKASLAKQGNITYNGQIYDLIIAYGKYVLSNIGMSSDIGTDRAEILEEYQESEPHQ